MRFLSRIKTDQELQEEARCLSEPLQANPRSVTEWSVIHQAAKNLAHHLDVRARVVHKLGT